MGWLQDLNDDEVAETAEWATGVMDSLVRSATKLRVLKTYGSYSPDEMTDPELISLIMDECDVVMAWVFRFWEGVRVEATAWAEEEDAEERDVLEHGAGDDE